MGRIFLLVALLYGYGDPGFDGHRPASLDRPLRNMHRAIDTTARDAQRVLIAINTGARAIPTVASLGDKLRHVGEALAPN
jgi:hypothetical protein